jgi:hypothetical protein
MVAGGLSALLSSTDVILEGCPPMFLLVPLPPSWQVPFLLKANLREYQQIGLDWLVTIYKKKLNGILADEVRASH